MNTVNETGRHRGRYLFTVFETGTSGVQRHNLKTGVTETIWQSMAGVPAARFDPAFWTPWGTLVTGEENWGDCSCPGLHLRPPVRVQEPHQRAGYLQSSGPDQQ